MRNLAIIPARSGSKGLPDKNIKLLKGKPLMAYSIEAAIKSGQFNTVHVSTDSEEYAEIARKYGADVPFLRSKESSSDTASSWEAVREVLDNYHNLDRDFDTFMLLQPTSPLRTSQDICNAYKLMFDKNAISVVSVCEAEHSPLQCNILPPDGSLVGFLNMATKGKRRQELGSYYRFNGAIYLAKTTDFLSTGDIYAEACFAYIMDSLVSIDIDRASDLFIAECYLKLNESNK